MDSNTAPLANSGNVLLNDTGYLQNLLQKGVKAQKLTLTLYQSHLKIEDANSGDTVEDVPIDQIKKVSRYFSKRSYYTLYGMFVKADTFFVVTPKRKYKISWVNQDTEKVLLGSVGGTEVADQQNYSKNMQWAKALKDLRK